MQFLKQMKVRALASNLFDSKQEQQRKKQEQQASTSKQKNSTALGDNIKLFAKSIFNKYKQQPKGNVQIAHNFDGQKRFWNVPTPQQEVTTNKTFIGQPNIKQDQKYLVDQESAACFIANLCSSVSVAQKQNKMKISKARNSIFGSLEVEPIYLSENCQHRILIMELENQIQQMIERTQQLVLQKNVLDRTIENALTCGYLWQAHNRQSQPFMQSCFSEISSQSKLIAKLYQQVKDTREELQIFLPYFNKISILTKKRIIIAKKLNLLKKIKSYKKDIEQQFKNIDQAFYIERSRQKLHSHFIVNQKIVAKVNLMKIMIQKIKKQNEKMKTLIQKQLVNWIDNQKQLQKKHIEKLLILLYFTKNQKMYFNYGLQVNESAILKNRLKFVEEINKVKNWEDYKYVNDKRVKQSVTEFLNALIKQLSGNNKDNGEREKRKIKLVKQQSAQVYF